MNPIDSLNKAFLVNFPGEAARKLEAMPMAEVIEVLEKHSPPIIAHVIERATPGIADAIILNLPTDKATETLTVMDTSASTAILSRLDEKNRQAFLSAMSENVATELRNLLEYPENSAGSLMHTHPIAFHEDMTVNQAIEQMKRQHLEAIHHLFLLDHQMKLQSQVDIHKIALAEGNEKLASLSVPIKAYVQALDPKDDVINTLKTYRVDMLPVVDIDNRLLGVIEGQGLIDAVRENVATDMQTMVGVSKDERALSSSFFAVRKRLPWLQINLLTAFLAAAVVGMFEDTIAKYTALAILLPIAAGQSGNAGAQALAVTMRGLTLREITMRHWIRVTMKECGAGLMNGIGIAITCSAGVYLWSNSIGLALVMAMAMIISMTIAGMSGAVVPILLKRFGLDPAQSSSIVLTTVTDIAGFMSFLGIATLLSGMLDAG